MRFRRRKYITDPGFQWRFVFGFMIAALIGSVAATVVFNYLAAKRIEELRWSVFLTAASTGEVLRSYFIYVNLFSLLFVAALLIITGIIMVKKMNGPLYRIIKSLKSIGEGYFSSDIILRQKDEFGDVASALNEMQSQIKERLGKWEAGQRKISQALKELEIAHAKGGQDGQYDKMVNRIVAIVQKLHKNI